MAGKTSGYPNIATSFVDGDLFDVSKLIGVSLYQSQKYTWSTLKGLILSTNIEQKTVSEMQALALANGFIGGKRYIIDSADGGDRQLLVVCAYGVTNQLYQTAIDVTTGEISTYDLATDDFINSSGTYTPTLTPDGTVVTTSVVEKAYYSKVGNIVTETIRIKNINADFTGGGQGSIDITDLAIPTASLFIIGQVNIHYTGFSGTPSSQLFVTIDSAGTVRIDVDDTGLTITNGGINIDIQYEIN